jgi:hypothetical protein
MRPEGVISRRVDAVMALAPAPAHLPALSALVAMTEAQLRALLPRVQSGEFRAKLVPKHPARPIREQHPGLWRQL